jgi:hypothetical protein
MELLLRASKSCQGCKECLMPPPSVLPFRGFLRVVFSCTGENEGFAVWELCYKGEAAAHGLDDLAKRGEHEVGGFSILKTPSCPMPSCLTTVLATASAPGGAPAASFPLQSAATLVLQPCFALLG